MPVSTFDDDDQKPHCCGHRFHPVEVLFFLLFLAGVALAVLGNLGIVVLDSIYGAAIYCAACVIGTAAIWGLVTMKRIAAATALIQADLQTFQAENDRARAMQAEKRAMDAEFKSKLGELEKAQLLLKGGREGLEDVHAKEQEMMKEREELLEKRRDLAGKLEADMKALWRTTISMAKYELLRRVQMYYYETDPGGEGITVGSEAWDFLKELMERNGIDIGDEVAGDDQHLEEDEFNNWLDTALDSHFELLEEALKDNEKHKEQIEQVKLDIELEHIEVKEHRGSMTLGTLY